MHNPKLPNCQGMTCFPLQRRLGVLPTPTSDTFGILQTPTTSEFQRHFGVLLIPSPFQQSPTLLHTPSTLTPHPTLPLKITPRPPSPPKVAWRPLRTPYPPIQTPLRHLRDSPSRSGDKAAPVASDIKGHVVKVICNIKGRGWSGSVGSAGRWPWS